MMTSRNIPAGLLWAICTFMAVAGTALAEEAVWQTDYHAAEATAKAEKKFVLAAFIGSDWCPWCKKLQTEVFDKKPFAAMAAKRFILVEPDFPHDKKLPDELKEQNAKLQKQYDCFVYPSVLILKPSGELVARTGYSEGGAENYTKGLADLIKTYEGLAGLRKQLPQTEGLDRAKLLDQLIDGYNKLGNEIGDIYGWRKEIVVLDANNAAGLRRKYEFRVFLVDAQKLLAAAKPVKAEAAIDKALRSTISSRCKSNEVRSSKRSVTLLGKTFRPALTAWKRRSRLCRKIRKVGEPKDLLERSEKGLKASKSQESEGKEGSQGK